jgi:hypothetical protein
MEVRDTSTITMSDGYGAYLDSYGSSTIRLDGGFSDDASLRDSSTLIVAGGHVGDDEGVWAWNASRIQMTDGILGVARAFDSSKIDLSGGEIYHLTLADASVFMMSGGTIRDIRALDNSTVTVTGGGFSTTCDCSSLSCGLDADDSTRVTLSGGLFTAECSHIIAGDASVVAIIGSGFAVDGTPVPYGELTSLGYILTGNLASGDSLDVIFGGNILLSAPTECSDYVDNDGDTLIDYPDDPGCINALSRTESPQCQDGVNNDPAQDGWIDFDGGASAGVPLEWQTDPDPECVYAWQMNEARCGLGAELALLLPQLMWLYRSRSRRV